MFADIFTSDGVMKETKTTTMTYIPCRTLFSAERKSDRKQICKDFKNLLNIDRQWQDMASTLHSMLYLDAFLQVYSELWHVEKISTTAKQKVNPKHVWDGV